MKYSITGDEGEFEPDSNQQVLKNQLGITDPDEMFAVENMLLTQLYQHLFEPELKVQQLEFHTLQRWHQIWLEPIYSWAGQIRTVDMSKDGFRFAAAQFLEKQLPYFEQSYLARLAETRSMDEEQLVQFLAELHVEFILIHPFREGNGRLSRLLMDVFTTCAGYAPLDYSLWFEHRAFYFAAIQAGVAGDYSHMQRLVRDVLLQPQ